MKYLGGILSEVMVKVIFNFLEVNILFELSNCKLFNCKVLSNRVSLSSIAKSFVGILAVWLSHMLVFLAWYG